MDVLSAAFTLTSLKAFALTRPSAKAGNKLIIHRTVVDGQLVGLHIEEPITADSSVAHMALLRFDAAGKIAEHWESIQGQPRRRANAHTMFDGPGVNYQSTLGKRGQGAAVAADQQAFNNFDTLAVRSEPGTRLYSAQSYHCRRRTGAYWIDRVSQTVGP